MNTADPIFHDETKAIAHIGVRADPIEPLSIRSTIWRSSIFAIQPKGVTDDERAANILKGWRVVTST